MSNEQLKRDLRILQKKYETAIANATILFNERTELCFNPDSETSKTIRENVIKNMDEWLKQAESKPKSKIISLNEASN